MRYSVIQKKKKKKLIQDTTRNKNVMNEESTPI